ncbi:hypothetical protein Dimus_012309 [Dionaea muscipula]
MEPSTQLMSGDNEHDEALRVNYLTQHFSQLTFAAAPYNETFIICKELLDDGSKKVASALKSVMLSRATKLEGTQVASNFHASDVPPNLSSNTLDQMSQFKLLDPNVSKTKGRRKGKEIVDGSGRMKSSLELATQKRKRKCKGCGQLARHDIRNCPVNPRARRKINVESPDGKILEMICEISLLQLVLDLFMLPVLSIILFYPKRLSINIFAAEEDEDHEVSEEDDTEDDEYFKSNLELNWMHCPRFACLIWMPQGENEDSKYQQARDSKSQMAHRDFSSLYAEGMNFN